MILLDHEIWPRLLPYVRLSVERDNLDLLQLSDELRAEALAVTATCVACGAEIHPLRARTKSKRSRIAGSGTDLERRLFYAATCPTEINAGCSRSKQAKEHKSLVRKRLGLAPRSVA